jgi:hypothetical protein
MPAALSVLPSFSFESLVARNFSGRFFHGPFGLLSRAFDSIFIHCHVLVVGSLHAGQRAHAILTKISPVEMAQMLLQLASPAPTATESSGLSYTDPPLVLVQAAPDQGPFVRREAPSGAELL